MASKPDGGSREQGKTSHAKILQWVVVFILGFVSGVGFTVYRSDNVVQTSSSGEEHDHGPSDETRQAILNLEADVTANPENFQSWVQLGNLYYDTDQPQKAIDAYTKSLELHSGNANILTDLGVMYRRVKQPEKAIEYFNQAIDKDPAHLVSRLNKGIVQYYDLNQHQEAFATWDALLAINPDARAGNGQSIADFVKQLRAETKSSE